MDHRPQRERPAEPGALHDRAAERTAQFRTDADYQGQGAEHRGKRGHHNRVEPRKGTVVDELARHFSVRSAASAKSIIMTAAYQQDEPMLAPPGTSPAQVHCGAESMADRVHVSYTIPTMM
jgi:hypothetical protein